jgi:hypothetical protein
MNDPDPLDDPESTQGTAQSTEQITNGGTASQGRASSVLRPQPDPARRAALEDAGTDSQDRASWVLRPLPDTQTGQPDPARHAALGSDPGTGGQPYAQLLESHEMQRILGQWKDIQAAFVDEPRKAVQDADALVAELMQRLAQTFASQREQLESQWAGGDDVSTEDLRRRSCMPAAACPAGCRPGPSRPASTSGQAALPRPRPAGCNSRPHPSRGRGRPDARCSQGRSPCSESRSAPPASVRAGGDQTAEADRA